MRPSNEVTEYIIQINVTHSKMLLKHPVKVTDFLLSSEAMIRKVKNRGRAKLDIKKQLK